MTFLASCAALALLFLSGLSLSIPWWNAKHHLLPIWGAWAAAILLAATLTFLVAVFALAAVGGAIVLFRDFREEHGLPYVSARPRERITGPTMRALRRMLNLWSGLRPGELVEIRSLPEILATLDERGCLDGLPFMPEMTAFCGHRFLVLRRVDKVYEYAHATGLRRMRNAVLLKGLRCGGQSHGGCQAACQLIWKESWLKRPQEERQETMPPRSTLNVLDLDACARIPVQGKQQYVCQMTEILRASTPLHVRDLRHYWRDVAWGNVRLIPFLVGISVKLFSGLQRKFGRPVWPVLQPTNSDSSPHQNLGLQPGQIVRVKPKHAIEPTLTRDLRTRGMQFDRAMLFYSGGSYRVATRVDRMVHERTGELLEFRSPCYALEGVHFIGENFFVPQNDFVFWREIWLDPQPPARSVLPTA
jgi:hypothetical protein